ncbi:MAG: hypothetical protein RIT47_799 [Pseudomonadota bacterium]|jgi:hypothetical protein
MTYEVTEEIYDEFLNEIYPEVKLGYSTFQPSEILKHLDPIAYNVGMQEYEYFQNEE